MENATDALKMAFAIFMFIVALTIAFSLLTKAKATSDTVLWYSDKTNYYSWDTGTIDNGRVVGEDTVISTLQSCKRNLIYVTIKNKSGEIIEKFTPSGTIDIESFINENLRQGKTYYENISEITTGGKYKVGNDGTKTVVYPATTRTYVTYTRTD